ncbi:MAG: CDP-alcohol phosphatidyltransferase family protein, partial [Lentisphaeria bacterium]
MTCSVWLVVIILGMLVAERVTSIVATKNPVCQEWIRKMPFLHPNGISLIRMPMGVVTVVLLAMGDLKIAILWFGFWMISDLTDGTIARNCNLKTKMGEWLDPLSDKFMYFPVLLFFALNKDLAVSLPLWCVLAFIVVDTVGQFSRLFAKKKAANLFGKAKTALVTILLATIAFAHMSDVDATLLRQPMVTFMAYSCLILAFLSFYCKIIPDEWYANTFTLANFLCGCCGIYLVFRHRYVASFVMIFIGQFFDLFDGRLARKFGSTKRGAFFDDIADATSFGLATGYLIFQALAFDEEVITIWIAILITFFYVGCLLYRLYRFLKPTKKLPPGIFQGLPSPAAALLAGSTVLACLQFQNNMSGIISAIVVIVGSLLM